MGKFDKLLVLNVKHYRQNPTACKYHVSFKLLASFQKKKNPTTLNSSVSLCSSLGQTDI